LANLEGWPPYQFGGKYIDGILVESWDDLWLTRDVEYCRVGIMNSANPCWLSWRFWKFIITILRNIKYPFLMYNPWSTKTIWISQMTTGSSLKLGSSFKVLIRSKLAVLRIWNVWKTRQLFVKIKFAPDTDIGRHERHAGRGAMKYWALPGLTSLHRRNLWVCWKSRRWWAQHARHFHVYEVTGNQLPPNPSLTQSILKISESVTRSKVSEQCSSRRPTAPARNSRCYCIHVTPANLRSWDLICSLLSLSFPCSLFLSLFLSSTQSVAFSCVASLSLYLKSILCS